MVNVGCSAPRLTGARVLGRENRADWKLLRADSGKVHKSSATPGLINARSNNARRSEAALLFAKPAEAFELPSTGGSS